MATKTQVVCDQCAKPIDPKSSIAFVPLRGGLTVSVASAAGTAQRDITSGVAFCGANCVNAWLSDIKPAPAPAAK